MSSFDESFSGRSNIFHVHGKAKWIVTGATRHFRQVSGGGNEFEHNEKLVAYMIAERPVCACAVLVQMAEGEKFSLDFYC